MISDFAKKYHEKMFPGCKSSFAETDPEFIERFDNFAFDEVVNNDDLDDKTRFLAILATLLGCQGVDEFRVMLGVALNFGVTPVEVKETVYQAAAYLGIGRVYPFLRVTNEVLTERGIRLPLEGRRSLYRRGTSRRGARSVRRADNADRRLQCCGQQPYCCIFEKIEH